MSQDSLLKWSAWFLIFGGILLAVGINIRTGFTAEVSEYEDPFFLPGIFLVMFGILLILIPLPLLYAFQAERAGKLGFFGFVLAYIGFAAYNLVITSLNFIWPVLAVQGDQINPLLALDYSAFPLVVDFSFITMWMQTIGFVLFGVATWKAGIYSRMIPALLILGGIVLVIFPIYPYNQKLGLSLISLAVILGGNHIQNEASS